MSAKQSQNNAMWFALRKIFIWVVPLFLAAALLSTPIINSPQVSDWLFRGSLLIILSVSWSLMANAGLISLGHSAFWGVGSYAAIMAANGLGLNREQWSALSLRW